MIPIDYRNATWESITDRLVNDRHRVWHAWAKHGPGTTREVSRRSGIDILSLRPRTTELCQLGFVEISPGDSGTEGTYHALTWAEARRTFEARAAAATSTQMQLL